MVGIVRLSGSMIGFIFSVRVRSCVGRGFLGWWMRWFFCLSSLGRSVLRLWLSLGVVVGRLRCFWFIGIE